MKKVLLTGGSRGIGKEIHDKLIGEGYEVFIPSRIELDLASIMSIEEYVVKNRNIGFDIIINNAGINPHNYIEDIKKEELEDCMNINIKAPTLLIQGFVHHMMKRKYGRIVNISSIWSVVSKEKRTTYAITKSGLIGLTKTLAIELGEYNILVNAVSPGFVDTELTNRNVGEEEKRELFENIPLERFARVDEIAELVHFLVSDRNTYITGQNIVIDGGYTIK